tara:strand:+ start:180 stop:806 length:627 start_codon:yes stop_codon:yes gene_type:complete
MAKTTIKLSVWKTLSRIDCSKHVEKKGRFNYLSWSWGWSILKENYPRASFEYIKTEGGNTAFKDEQGYAFVRVAVTVDEQTLIEDLAVMDNHNKDIKNPKPTEINNSLKRCLVKAMAFHGLGINVYAGEDTIMFDEVKVAIARQKAEVKTAKDTLDEMAKRKAVAAYMKNADNVGDKARLLAWAGVKSLDELTIEQINKAHKQMEITA